MTSRPSASSSCSRVVWRALGCGGDRRVRRDARRAEADVRRRLRSAAAGSDESCSTALEGAARAARLQRASCLETGELDIPQALVLPLRGLRAAGATARAARSGAAASRRRSDVRPHQGTATCCSRQSSLLEELLPAGEQRLRARRARACARRASRRSPSPSASFASSVRDLGLARRDLRLEPLELASDASRRAFAGFGFALLIGFGSRGGRRRALARRAGAASPPSRRRRSAASPSSIASVRSATASSSARSCETSSTVPGNASSAASSASRLSRSRWFVGSSSTRKFAPDATTTASASRRRSPPDSTDDRLLVLVPAREEEAAEQALRLRPRAGRSSTARTRAPSRASSSSTSCCEKYAASTPWPSCTRPPPAAAAEHRLEQRRLARAVRPDERDVLAALERERRVVAAAAASPTATSRPSASTTVRPLRGGFRNSKPSVRCRRVRQRDLGRSRPARSFSSRPICVSFACACFAFVLLVAEALDEALEPRDVAPARGRPSFCGVQHPRRLLAPPRVPRARGSTSSGRPRARASPS